MDPIITILAVVTKDIPISPRFSTLTIRQPIVEFTYSRSHAFRYGRKNIYSLCNSILLLPCGVLDYIVSGLFLLFFWCPCMVINVNVQTV